MDLGRESPTCGMGSYEHRVEVASAISFPPRYVVFVARGIRPVKPTKASWSCCTQNKYMLDFSIYVLDQKLSPSLVSGTRSEQ